MGAIFSEDAGRFVSPREAKHMKGTYRRRKLYAGIPDADFVRSEYFGINQVMHLLNQPGCVGLRIHHAKRWEDADGNPVPPRTGQLRPRVLLTGVDSNGNDMPIRPDNGGLKDGDGGGQALGDGFTCPQHCPGTN